MSWTSMFFFNEHTQFLVIDKKKYNDFANIMKKE